MTCLSVTLFLVTTFYKIEIVDTWDSLIIFLWKDVHPSSFMYFRKKTNTAIAWLSYKRDLRPLNIQLNEGRPSTSHSLTQMHVLSPVKIKPIRKFFSSGTQNGVYFAFMSYIVGLMSASKVCMLHLIAAAPLWTYTAPPQKKNEAVSFLCTIWSFINHMVGEMKLWEFGCSPGWVWAHDCCQANNMWMQGTLKQNRWGWLDEAMFS